MKTCTNLCSCVILIIMSCVNLEKVSSNSVRSAVSEKHIELGSLWRHQTVVMFFLRRFGCQVHRWTAVEVSKLEKDLRQSGIGPDDTGLQEFMDGDFLKGEIYIDEMKQRYKDLGF